MKLLTAAQLAELLGMNTAVVLRWHRAGRIPSKIDTNLPSSSTSDSYTRRRLIRFVYDDVIEALHATAPKADPSFLVY